MAAEITGLAHIRCECCDETSTAAYIRRGPNAGVLLCSRCDEDLRKEYARLSAAPGSDVAECPECGNWFQPWDRIWNGDKWRCRLCALQSEKPPSRATGWTRLFRAVRAFLDCENEGATVVHPGTDEDVTRLDVGTDAWEELWEALGEVECPEAYAPLSPEPPPAVSDVENRPGYFWLAEWADQSHRYLADSTDERRGAFPHKCFTTVVEEARRFETKAQAQEHCDSWKADGVPLVPTQHGFLPRAAPPAVSEEMVQKLAEELAMELPYFGTGSKDAHNHYVKVFSRRIRAAINEGSK